MNQSLNNAPDKVSNQTRKLYEKPELKILGDVRSIILGGSPGTGESGGAGGKKRKKP